ncbi:MAG TPA: MT-A70 family methyltransferase [Methanofastidiosum sp.]|nr:MT-A70 family methyltransferase [Methanofastidiosum sp.]
MKYKTIYCDPPWPEFGGGKIKRGADRHYPLMSIKQIINMKDFISEISEDNCHLYMWTTNNYLPSALQVIKEWGFEYKTIITWLKDRFGLGQYYRGITEHCLFAIKGNIPYKTIDGKRQQGITGFTAPRQEHSVKPEEMRQMIEKVSYPPYIELFARRKDSQLWHYWGNEINNDLKEI